jgi:hypothetical protein
LSILRVEVRVRTGIGTIVTEAQYIQSSVGYGCLCHVHAFAAGAMYNSAICSGGFAMCDNNVGVAKRLDLESISQDIAKLVKELDKEVEGKVKVGELKKIEAKVHKIISA